MTSVCQIQMVFYSCDREVVMFEKIIKTFFTKSYIKTSVKTYIKDNREICNNGRAENQKVFCKKNPENIETYLSGYFKNNKGLNVVERTTKLYVATIVA